MTYRPIPSVKKVITYAYRDAITGIDPGVEFDTGVVVLHLVYEPLLKYDPLKDEFTPLLAVSWEKINDTTWLFVLRDGVKFQDGTPLNAEAVKFSIERARDIYSETGKGPGYVWSCIEEVIVVNKTTVLFKLSYPARVDLIASGAYGAFIYSPKVVEYSGATSPTDPKLEEWFNEGNAVGTGPYKLASYRPESEVRLVKNNDWWGWKEIDNPSPPDEVIIKIIETPEAQESGLRAKSIDVATNIPRASIPGLESQGYSKVVIPSYHNFILVFNTQRYPTNIAEVRKAIAYAIPYDELINTVLRGYGRIGSGLVPYSFPGYIGNLTYKHDLSLAQKLLEEAGLVERISLEIVITLGYEEEEKFASLLKNSLANLGIELTITSLPWEFVKERGASVWVNPNEAPHLIINDWWPTYPSPYEYYYIFHKDNREWNWAGYEDEEYSQIIDEAFVLEGIDWAKSMELYMEAAQTIFNNVIAINLWDMMHIYVYDGGRLMLREEAFNPLYSYVIFFQYVEVKT